MKIGFKSHLKNIAFIIFSLFFALNLQAKEYEVKMLNRNAEGAMVYEPSYLHIKEGDTVKFLATKTGHNAASIDEIMPEGEKSFTGKIDEEIIISPTKSGWIGVKCSPHYAMGMVMMIRVGDADLSDFPKLPDNMPARAKERFEKIKANLEK